MFNIELDDKFLLIKSERRNQFQPVGGCYKYFPEAEEFLFSIGAIPEKVSNGVNSLMDLRLLLPEENLELFTMWFKSGDARETGFEREFYEEIGSLIPSKSQSAFENLQTKKQAEGSFDIFFDSEKNIFSIKPMDIIALDLTDKQKQILKKVVAQNSARFIFASKDDILKGYKVLDNGTKVKIGGHTKNILPVSAQIFGE